MSGENWTGSREPQPRPLIGVTTSEVRLEDQVRLTPHGEPARREMALGLTYLRAIERAGGIPVVIPPLEVEAIPSLLAHLDATELALARQAIAIDLPMLAISRGAQALNIARGGTLFQHLPERFGRSI